MTDIDDPNGIIIPDVPQTVLAFRTWRVSEDGNRLLSINAPSLTGKAGGSNDKQVRRVAWIHRAMASDGQEGWPIGGPLVAHCGVQGQNAEKNEDHGNIPSKTCSCGVYATTSIKVINQYLGNEVIQGTIAIRGPVLGIVEMGGRVIPATQGFRAAFARVAGIIEIGAEFSLSGPQLKQIAATYRVPLLKDKSKDPENYRNDIGDMPVVADPSSIGDEMEEWLKGQEEEGGE
jgi:hypothetical protein